MGLRSREATGEAECGGEAGGEEGGFDLGVRERKAEGPVGECIEEEMEVLREEVGREGEEGREELELVLAMHCGKVIRLKP